MPSTSNAGTLIENLSRRFRWHSEHIYGVPTQNASSLYAHLSREVAADSAVLSLVEDADLSQQVSNLLLGAVHFLLLGNARHPLANYYPSLTPSPLPYQESYPAFRTFCLEHTEVIRDLVTARRVQTNEVNRCTALLPTFGVIAKRAEGRPLALIEIGPSAGLNLFWDKYRYDYGKAGKAGNPSSPIKLSCKVLGQYQLPLPDVLPSIVNREGIDLAPIDVNDESATRWLRALIWPEHKKRAELLEQALELARLEPPSLIAGSAVDVLPEILANAPEEAVLCVYHSYTLNQCSKSAREAILEHLTEFLQTRDFFRISLEWYSGQAQPQLELFFYSKGESTRELLAYCESHGRTIEWLVKQ
jgi:hypothetical protein